MTEKMYILKLTEEELYNLHEATSVLLASDQNSVQLAKRGNTDHQRFADRYELTHKVYTKVNNKLGE